MLLRSLAQAALVVFMFVPTAHAQSAGDAQPSLTIELNTVNSTGSACRMTFVAENKTGSDVTQVVFETVIFDASGGVLSLTLFDFRDLPVNRPRVRQFDIAGLACDALGRVLINGSSTCMVDGSESDICNSALAVSSRLDVELLG